MPSFSYWALFGFVLSGSAVFAQVPTDDPGRRLFETHCAYCHGPHGEGGKGPTLAQPNLPRASTDEALLGIIRKGIDGTEMPRAHLSPDQRILVAKYVRTLGQIDPEPVRGNPAHGKQLYDGAACARCHTVHGQGGAVGPDLTEIGRRRSAAYLRRAVTDPGAEVPQSFSAYRSDVSLPENFLLVRATTRAGVEITGVRVNEDTFSIQLRDLDGQIHSLQKSDLTALHKDWGVSPMPSFAASFSANEIDDLVAYLASLRGPPPTPMTTLESAASSSFPSAPHSDTSPSTERPQNKSSTEPRNAHE